MPYEHWMVCKFQQCEQKNKEIARSVERVDKRVCMGMNQDAREYD